MRFLMSACRCNVDGSLGPYCSKLGGLCECKPNVIGRCCDTCSPLTFGFGPDGCRREKNFCDSSRHHERDEGCFRCHFRWFSLSALCSQPVSVTHVDPSQRCVTRSEVSARVTHRSQVVAVISVRLDSGVSPPVESASVTNSQTSVTRRPESVWTVGSTPQGRAVTGNASALLLFMDNRAISWGVCVKDTKLSSRCHCVSYLGRNLPSGIRCVLTCESTNNFLTATQGSLLEVFVILDFWICGCCRTLIIRYLHAIKKRPVSNKQSTKIEDGDVGCFNLTRQNKAALVGSFSMTLSFRLSL